MNDWTWSQLRDAQAITWVMVAYASMSALTFVVYAVDKRAARAGRPRIAEATLHVLESLGGWPGALLAQRLLRHKNAKPGYQVVFWLVVAAHVAAWVMIALRS